MIEITIEMAAKYYPVPWILDKHDLAIIKKYRSKYIEEMQEIYSRTSISEIDTALEILRNKHKQRVNVALWKRASSKK